MSRTASGSSACSSGRSASFTAAGSVAFASSIARCSDHRPGVHAAVVEHEVHGDAEDLHAVVDRLLDRAHAGEGRQQRGVDVHDRVREAAEERARQQRHVAGEHDELHVAADEPVGDRGVARAAVGEVADRKHGGLDARVARASERAAPSACRRRRRRRAPRGRGRCPAAPAGSSPRPMRARRRAAARPRHEPLALRPPFRAGDRAVWSLGYIPPVERRRPASSSSSTRAMTCLAVRWSNVP